MSAERLRTYIDEMHQVAFETIEFTQGITKETFLKDLVLQRAIGMNLLMIGEITTRLMEEHRDFIDDFPDVPWQKIRGMRNRIAHGYMSINLDTVWDTVHGAIPDLLEKLHAIRNWHAQGE